MCLAACTTKMAPFTLFFHATTVLPLNWISLTFYTWSGLILILLSSLCQSAYIQTFVSCPKPVSYTHLTLPTILRV